MITPELYLLRRIVNRLARIFALTGDDNPDCDRASGLVICDTCGFDYYHHAQHPYRTDLTMLCDGRNVHL